MFYDINITISINTCHIHNIPTPTPKLKGYLYKQIILFNFQDKKDGMKTDGNTILQIRGKKHIA